MTNPDVAQGVRTQAADTIPAVYQILRWCECGDIARSVKALRQLVDRLSDTANGYVVGENDSSATKSKHQLIATNKGYLA